MDELYVVVLEISAESDGYYVKEKINEKVIMDSPVHRYDGFEFRILSADDEFVQALIYADNPYTTRVLGLNVDNAGKKVGVLFDSPVLIETDGGFAGVLCSYVFQVSRHYIDVNKMYTLLGADIKSRKLMIESYAGLRDKLLEQKRRMEFSEMMHYMERNKDLQSHTLRMVEHTKLYQENFVSKYESMKAGRVSCEESMMLIVAKAYAEEGKHVAVLNSGNPVEPNGQIFKGSDTEEEKIVIDIQTELLNKDCLYQNGIPIAKHILEIQTDFYTADQQIYVENGTMLILQDQGKGIFLEENEKVKISVKQENMNKQPGHTFEIGYIENGKPFKLDTVAVEQYEVWVEGGDQKEYFPYFKNISSDRIILNYQIAKESGENEENKKSGSDVGSFGYDNK